MKWLYLVLAILGAALPLSQFVPASMDGSFSVVNLMGELMATRNLRGITFDLMVAAVTGVVFMIAEGRRLAVRFFWVPLIGTVRGRGLLLSPPPPPTPRIDVPGPR